MEVSHLTFFSEHYWMPVAVRAVSTEPRGGLPKISQVAYKDKWIFVVSTSKNLYAGVIGTFHHSSFLAGGATLAAGRLEAEQGILKITGQQMTCLAAFFLFSRKMESTLMKLKLRNLRVISRAEAASQQSQLSTYLQTSKSQIPILHGASTPCISKDIGDQLLQQASVLA
ncbi:hypothetical protein Q3G72_012383 [Acer saccharum]|nr:hypothetical protein Q3G72_012383 [Acer saccharum]